MVYWRCGAVQGRGYMLGMLYPKAGVWASDHGLGKDSELTSGSRFVAASLSYQVIASVM